ncbi:MAG: multiheme c-type cytochrome [Pirellulaceae bacterium]|nr:multiheme c-type cytochrome [Pirellulaceae bacterium]
MMDWELIVYLLVAVFALLPLIVRLQKASGGVRVVSALVVIIILAGAVLVPPRMRQPEQADLTDATIPIKHLIPKQLTDHEFVSSQTCRSCHPQEHASWHQTYHRSMTQVASPDTVLAPFDDVHLKSRGREFHLTREGDQFWVAMPDPDMEHMKRHQGEDPLEGDPRMTRRRIVMMTGSHHFQAYWVRIARGNDMSQLPWVWDIKEREWLPAEDVFIRPPDHGRRLQVWNDSCVTCHALNGRDKKSSELFTEVTELGISCEACHGPGRAHVEHYRNPLTRYQSHGKKLGGTKIINPATCSATVSSQICGSCHSAWDKSGSDRSPQRPYRPGDDLEKSVHLFRFGDKLAESFNEIVARSAYWQDGTLRVGGREYLAMIDSPCYTTPKDERRMSCLSCHSMHRSDPDDQLAAKMDGNQACLQCHQQFKTRIREHTHHAAGSSGSKCYNCHMPHTSYALLKAIRSHRVEVPSVSVSAAVDKPTGCNQCHLDKSLQWTADYLKKWYEIKTEPLAPQHQTQSATLALLLRGDAAERAISAWTCGWPEAQQATGHHGLVPALAQLLTDPYAAVRRLAFQSLRSMKEFEDLQFDFVGSEEHRKEVQQQVMLRWEAVRGTIPELSRPALLLDEQGNVQLEAFQELLKQRDDQPVEFPE